MFSQNIAFTCDKCGREFEEEVWLMVDASERPDLVQRVVDGSIREMTCPYCGYVMGLDAPFLLFRPDEDPSIIISPSFQGDEEELFEFVEAMVPHLRARRGAAWKSEHIERFEMVPFYLLPALLSDDPNVDVRGLMNHTLSELKRLEEENPEGLEEMLAYIEHFLDPWAEEEGLEADSEDIESALVALELAKKFLEVKTWEDAKELVSEHPELLSEDVDRTFALLIKLARVEGDEDIAWDYEMHRSVLQRCREEGIDAAFDELIAEEALEFGDVGLVDNLSDEEAAFWEALRSLPYEQRMAVDEIARSSSSAEEFAARMIEQPALGMAIMKELARVTGDEKQLRKLEVVEVVDRFVETKTWPEARRLVEAHPELLSDEADEVLTEMMAFAMESGDREGRSVLREHRSVLRRSRKVGVRRAFAEKMR